MVSLLQQIVALSEMGENVFDINTALRQATALHGMAICLGIVEYDEAISGQDLLEKVEEYLKENLVNDEEEG